MFYSNRWLYDIDEAERLIEYNSIKYFDAL